LAKAPYRDRILAGLKRTLAGPSLDVYVNDLPGARGKPPSGPVDGAGRRSVYLGIRRNFLDSFLSVFGMPNATAATGKRNITNVPSQALALINSPFVHAQAEA